MGSVAWEGQRAGWDIQSLRCSQQGWTWAPQRLSPCPSAPQPATLPADGDPSWAPAQHPPAVMAPPHHQLGQSQGPGEGPGPARGLTCQVPHGSHPWPCSGPPCLPRCRLDPSEHPFLPDCAAPGKGGQLEVLSLGVSESWQLTAPWLRNNCIDISWDHGHPAKAPAHSHLFQERRGQMPLWSAGPSPGPGLLALWAGRPTGSPNGLSATRQCPVTRLAVTHLMTCWPDIDQNPSVGILCWVSTVMAETTTGLSAGLGRARFWPQSTPQGSEALCVTHGRIRWGKQS